MAWEYGPTAPGASILGLLGPWMKKEDLTRGEDGGQGRVGRDGGRHCRLEGSFECENLSFGRRSSYY